MTHTQTLMTTDQRPCEPFTESGNGSLQDGFIEMASLTPHSNSGACFDHYATEQSQLSGINHTFFITTIFTACTIATVCLLCMKP